MTRPPEWHAEHVFVSPGRSSDLFLLRIVAPFLRALADGPAWFFVRYGEGGPHLRIRVATDREDAVAAIGRRWREVAPDFVDAAPPGPEWAGTGGPACLPGSVHTVPYDPETARYGGERALALNERAFCRSSALALGIVAATMDDAGRRLGQAMRIMVATAGTIADGPAAVGALLRRYAEGWRRYLEPSGWTPEATPFARVDPASVRAALAPGDGRATYGAAWLAVLADLRAGLEQAGPLSAAPADIVMSQLHMFCNRLGVSPAMEFHLATQIGESL